MPNQKLKLILLAVLGLAFFALSEKAEAAIFVDNDAPSCSNGLSTYDPATRACGSGSDTVYTTLRNADSGVDAGTSGNPRVINVRVGNTYSEKLGINKVWTTWRKYPGDSGKPVVYGNSSNVSNYKGLINVKADGVTVDGLELYTAPSGFRGYGVMVDQVNNVNIKNCYIHHTGGAGIYLVTADYVTIENNELYEVEYTRTESGGERGAGLCSRAGCDHIIIRGNYMHGCGGEGFNLNRKGEDYLVEYNILCDIWAVGIFPDQIRDAIIRYNLVYHTGATRFKGGGNSGISVGAEDFPSTGQRYDGYATNIDVYGNVIVGYKFGLGIGHVAVQEGYNVSYTRFYNNTVIEPFAGGSAVAIGGRAGYTGNPTGPGVEFKNNIFWQTDGNIASINTLSSAAWANNLWSKAPTASAQSETDPRHPGYEKMQTSDTALYFNKGSGWDSIVHGSLTGQEFALKPTATHARGKGANLGADYSKLLNLASSNFKTNTYNFKNQPATGAWDIGAGVYGSGGGDTTPPTPPSGLSVR